LSSFSATSCPSAVYARSLFGAPGIIATSMRSIENNGREATVGNNDRADEKFNFLYDFTIRVNKKVLLQPRHAFFRPIQPPATALFRSVRFDSRGHFS
jgi:hypothetical protein